MLSCLCIRSGAGVWCLLPGGVPRGLPAKKEEKPKSGQPKPKSTKPKPKPKSGGAGAAGGGGGGGEVQVPPRGLPRRLVKRKQDGGAGAGKEAAKKTTKSKSKPSKRVKVARAAGGKGWEVIKFDAMVYSYPPPKKQAGEWRAGFYLANVERKTSPYGVKFVATYQEGIWANLKDEISATDELWRIVPMGAFLDELKADVSNAGTNQERASAARGEMLASDEDKETVRSIRHIYGVQPDL